VLNHVEKNAKNTPLTPGPTLVLRMTSIGHAQAGAVALANATQDIKTLKSGRISSIIGKAVDSGVNNSDLLSSLSTVLSRLQIVLDIGAQLAKASD
jgi:hypothetical protein